MLNWHLDLIKSLLGVNLHLHEPLRQRFAGFDSMRRDVKLFGLIVWLACGALARGAVAEEANALYVMRPDGSEVRLVARVGEKHAHMFPRWSHDGKRLTFEVLALGTTDRRIYVVNVDGSGLREVGPDSMPDWSPDDKQLVSHRLLADDPLPDVYVQNADGAPWSCWPRGARPAGLPTAASWPSPCRRIWS